jgi:hypothetical protein
MTEFIVGTLIVSFLYQILIFAGCALIVAFVAWLIVKWTKRK